MNPISKVTGAITHPVRTATTVAGGAFGVAAAGVRTASRIVGRGGQEGGSSTPAKPETPEQSTGTPDVAPAPAAVKDVTTTPGVDAAKAEVKTADKPAAKKTPAKKAAAGKAPTKKTPTRKPAAKRAPSAKAATAGPALAAETAVPAALVDDEATHVETETEVVYSSETGAAATSDDHLTEPLLDPALAEQLKSQTEQGTDSTQG